MFSMIKSLLIISICMMLVACPEAGSDIRTFCPSTAKVDSTDPTAPTIGNTLRTYEADDKIEYVVSGVSNGNAVSGSLTLEWKAHTPLLKPFPGITETISVIEEKATLSIQAINLSTYRYIEQNKVDPAFPNDPYKRTMNLWAFSDGGPNYYWFNSDPNLLNSVQDLIIGSSPIDELFLGSGNGPISTTFTIYPMSGCGKTSTDCADKFALYTESSDIYNKEIVETIQGTFFDAYRIQIPQGSITKTGTEPSTPLPIPLDFKHACSNSGSINYSGTVWLFPEIGIIKSVINCTSTTGGNYNLTYNFNYANFNMPASEQGQKSCS